MTAVVLGCDPSYYPCFALHGSPAKDTAGRKFLSGSTELQFHTGAGGERDKFALEISFSALFDH